LADSVIILSLREFITSRPFSDGGRGQVEEDMAVRSGMLIHLGLVLRDSAAKCRGSSSRNNLAANVYAVTHFTFDRSFAAEANSGVCRIQQRACRKEFRIQTLIERT